MSKKIPTTFSVDAIGILNQCQLFLGTKYISNGSIPYSCKNNVNLHPNDALYQS